MSSDDCTSTMDNKTCVELEKVKIIVDLALKNSENRYTELLKQSSKMSEKLVRLMEDMAIIKTEVRTRKNTKKVLTDRQLTLTGLFISACVLVVSVIIALLPI